MKTRPFIIDEAVKGKFAALVEYAEKHPFKMDELLDVANKQAKPAGDYKDHTLELDFGYRVVFSIEHQPAGTVRHLSMSVDEERCLPGPGVVEETMKLCGFETEMAYCKITLEDISPNRQAINIYEVTPAK